MSPAGRITAASPPTPYGAPAASGGACLASSDATATPVEIPHNPGLDLRTYTIAAWVNTKGSGWHQTILARQYGNELAQAFRLAIFQSDLVLECRDGQGLLPLTYRPSTNQDTWLHVAGTYDGITMRLYLNGAPVASVDRACAAPADTNPIFIGASREQTALWSSFNGRVDEVRLYDRALTPQEIATIAAAR